MKKIDFYILKQFLKNFFSAFFIIMLIFVFHTIWMYIDEFAGKGLSVWIIIKFIIFVIPSLIPIILPFTVVLSSTMTLGALGENYEIAAMKASGISLIRMVRSLILFMLFLSICVFFTANNLQPLSTEKASNLRANVAKVQPSLAISEGIFTHINQFSIKVDKKTGENGEFLHGVTIHLTEENKNTTLIKSKEGELVNNNRLPDVLQLILKDGTYYKDIKSNRPQETHPFIKSKFEVYTMNIDISNFNKNVDFNEQHQFSSAKMLNVNKLSHSIDSLKNNLNQVINETGQGIYRRIGLDFVLKNTPSISENTKDTIRSFGALNKMVASETRIQIYQMTKSNLESLLSTLDFRSDEIEIRKEQINFFRLTFSDKFALAFTCFVLFFVAAPLGAFIRKGGIGMPLVVAMALFLSYYFMGIFLKNLAEKGAVNPYLAPWIPAIILLPLGFYFTYKTNKDQPIFPENTFSFDFLKKFFKKKSS